MKRNINKYLLLSFALLLAVTSHAQRITTIAGTVSPGYTGNGGPATAAQLTGPGDIIFDHSGNMLFADEYNNVIRRITADGRISVVAGDGNPSYYGNGGPAVAAALYVPMGIAMDNAGNLFIGDADNNVVRKVDTAGNIDWVLGADPGYYGDGGPATDALMNSPRGMAFDASGNLFIADCWNHVIRKIDAAGIITTVAGNGHGAGYAWGTLSGDHGMATDAGLSNPNSVRVDGFGNIYIADKGNSRIRKVDPSGIITTVAGGGNSLPGDDGPATDAVLNTPTGIALDNAGNLYIADQYNYCIRKVDASGIISRVAGSYVNGYSGDGGNAIDAHLKLPIAVAVDPNGNVYIADFGNNCIRKVDTSHSLGIGQVKKAGKKVAVFPNPNSGAFSLCGSLVSPVDQQVSIRIDNILGQVVYSNSVPAKNGEINTRIALGDIPGGLYVLHIGSETENEILNFVISR